MKAIIMAGGEGRRLKPVTGDTPKPLAMLCGRPIMEHIILLLKKHGITDICCALKYRAQDIKDCFGDGERLGVRLQYRVEESALGTAGGVKNCADFYKDEDFLVISGDAACDFDLSEMIAAHKSRKAAATIALFPEAEPLRYGLALCDREGYIRSFIEKPDWGRVVTNLVNTGIYILTPRAMQLVPQGKEFDFAKDLFPALLDGGEKLLGFQADGYWCDIGTPRSYYECCADALAGRFNISLAGGFEAASESPAAKPRSGMKNADCICCDRARLMDRISCAFLGLGAEYSDGFLFRGGDYELRIEALPDSAAVRISANATDTETAGQLVSSASALVRELEKRLDN